jgi:hypothetical protein
MDVEQIPIAEVEQFKTYRQVIRAASAVELMEYISAMDAEIRVRKFTGKLTINWNQGGTRLIVAEQIAPEFSE